MAQSLYQTIHKVYTKRSLNESDEPVSKESHGHDKVDFGELKDKWHAISDMLGGRWTQRKDFFNTGVGVELLHIAILDLGFDNLSVLAFKNEKDAGGFVADAMHPDASGKYFDLPKYVYGPFAIRKE